MTRLYKSNNQYQSGFTLVELMVVVAIIGILASVAVPSFNKYQAQSRASEAKLQLATLYTSEQSFFSDYNTYGHCLDKMGFDPRLQNSQRYYAIGVAATGADVNLPVTNGANCPPGAVVWNSPTPINPAAENGTAFYAYGAGKIFGSAGAAAQAVDVSSVSGVAMTNTTFTAGASGIISSSSTTANSTHDQWSIDQIKFLKHTRTGY